jgi:hypothetical protein
LTPTHGNLKTCRHTNDFYLIISIFTERFEPPVMTISKLKLKLKEDLENLPEPLLKEIDSLVQKSLQAKKLEEPAFRQFGSMAGLLVYMAPDFNDPLDDFKEYQ